MKEDKDSKSHVSWCWKQKRGIKLEEPNDNLCNVYFKKAKSSLNILESAIEKSEIDWITTTAYYARYFAFYALLQKCGIKSEIHDCTISLMHFLFVKEDLIEEHFYTELLLAKELRVDTQYYVTEEIDLNKLKEDSGTARSFVLRMEEVAEALTEKQVKIIRNKLKANKECRHNIKQ
ncbi:MAG: HEPN domain-containing protein [Nanoarchaeota archaeon]|nr:HEPN domain-containing protein [Nanoarchaeota archaeon]